MDANNVAQIQTQFCKHFYIGSHLEKSKERRNLLFVNI